MGPYSLIYAVVTLGLGVLFFRAAWNAYYGPAAHVPGPWYTRWTELPVKYYWVTGQRVKYVHALHQKYGPVVRVRPTEVSIVDLQATREIHRMSTPFVKAAWYLKITGGNVNLFSIQDPKKHSARRRLLASPLSDSSLKNVEPTVNDNVSKTMDGIGKEIKMEGSADILKWFTFMATDVIGELCFAESFRMLDHAQPNQYFRDLQTVALASALRSELGKLVYIFGFLGIEPFSQALYSVGRIIEYSRQSFARYEQHVVMNPTNPKPTLFTKMLQKVEGEESLPRDDLIREGQAYIVAGSDTTALTSTYFVYAVTRHPEVREKLIAELSTLPSNFGWEEIRYLPYLNKCIDETLRLHGVASSALPRIVPSGGARLAGYGKFTSPSFLTTQLQLTLGPEFPSGFIVSTQAYSLHRNPSIFVDPLRFNPDRWDNPTQEMKHSFMPFGIGTRNCIGQHLARDEMRMAMALFFRSYPNARVLSSDEEMEPMSYFLVQPRKKSCIVALS
ncbi:MAG: hypothetical protein LQ340_005464 [Diploschistes diacapsis]|nr:MAG: hypothetical protein LQ340_005464 [Diploschistes diacapsis]